MKHSLMWYLLIYFIAKFAGQRLSSGFNYDWILRKNAAKSTYRGGLLRSGPDETLFNASLILSGFSQIIAALFLAMADRVKL